MTPATAIRRLGLRDFLELFDQTFPDEFKALFGHDPGGVAARIDLLVGGRDAAGHPGRPYLSAEVRMAMAAVWEIAVELPAEFHDPPDLVLWLGSQSLVDAETWEDEAYDVTTDCPLSPEFWRDAHSFARGFRRVASGGDGGFAVGLEGILAVHKANLFMRAGELTLGTGMPAFSGLFHEHDLGVSRGRDLVVLELKQRQGSPLNKDDVLIFNQKTLDFQLALIRAGDRSRLLRAFVTNATVSDAIRSFCLQWGIVLIDRDLLPIPVLTAAMRDLDGQPEALREPTFEARLRSAEQLAGLLRPLDRVLVPSSLSKWRRLFDSGLLPDHQALVTLISEHRRLNDFALRLISGSSAT